jgi:hypothetical protein
MRAGRCAVFPQAMGRPDASGGWPAGGWRPLGRSAKLAHRLEMIRSRYIAFCDLSRGRTAPSAASWSQARRISGSPASESVVPRIAPMSSARPTLVRVARSDRMFLLIMVTHSSDMAFSCRTAWSSREAWISAETSKRVSCSTTSASASSSALNASRHLRVARRAASATLYPATPWR